MNTQAQNTQVANDADMISAQEQALYNRLEAILGTPKELNTEQQKQAEALEKQMEALFESIGETEPTAAQQKQLDALSGQLDKLYGLKAEAQLTDAEKKEVEEIFSKLDEIGGGDEGETDAATQALFDRLDAIFGTPKELSAEEQKQAEALEKQMEALFESIGEAEPTAAQQKQLDALSGQLDKLYGLKTEDQLTDAEKKEVEEIFSKLDEIGGGDEGETDAATQALFDRLDAIFGTPKELSAEEQKQAEALEKQMEALFESIGEAEPTAEQEKQLDALSGQLDKLYGLKTEDQLTDAEKKEVEDIFAKLDETTGGDEVEGGLDAETQGLFDRLDAIFGTPKELNAEEQKQADALDKQLGDLFESIGEAEPTEAQQKQMDALFTQMDKLYGLKSEDQLTDAEKKEVEEIFAKLDSAMGGDDGFEGGEGQEDGDWGIDFGDETVSWANDGAEGGDNSWSNEDWGNDNWGSDNASGNSNSSAMVWGNESWSDDSWGNDGGVELTGLAAAGNDSVSFDWF